MTQVSRQTAKREHEPLPRGLHSLSRDEVVASQRERLLLSATQVAAEKGYAATSVADILKRARVSRLTFYEQFANKEACFVAAYELVSGEVIRRVGKSFGGDGSPMERAESAIRSYLETLASEPELARFFLIESYAVGPELIRRRFANQRTMGQLIASRFGSATERQRTVCEGVLGSIISLVSSRLMLDGPAAIPALQEHLMDLVRPALESLADLD